MALDEARSIAADGALEDSWQRHEHLLKVEQGYGELQRLLKWRDEQFESLEEAHAKLRVKFKESQCEWETEKAEMVKVIDCQRDRLESKGKLANHLHHQLDLLRQALDHEHVRHKGFVQEMAEAKAAMGAAAAECQKARLAFDIAREETATKVGILNQYVVACGNYLNGAEAREVALKVLDAEDRVSGQASNGLSVSYVDVETSKGEVVSSTRIAWENEDMDKFLSIVQETEAFLACKNARLRELGIEISGTKSLLDVLGDPDAQPYQLNAEERTEGHATANLGTEARVLNQLIVNSVAGTRVGESDERGAVGPSDSHSLQEMARFREQETRLDDLQMECENLQNLLKQREAQQRKMQRAHDKALAQLRAEGKMLQDEREKLVSNLVNLESQGIEKEQKLKEMQSNMERLREVIRKLESRGAVLKQQIEQQCLLAELATGQLAIERADGERLKREAQVLTESFEAAMAAKDSSLEQLRVRIHELEEMYAGSTQAVYSEDVRSSSLEKKLEVQQELLGHLKELLHEKSMELDKYNCEAERMALAEQSLEDQFRDFEIESKSSKSVLEAKLQTMEVQLSLAENQLHELRQQLGSVSSERDTLVEDLITKDAENVKLKKENTSLVAATTALEDVAKSLEAKKLELMNETESNKVVIDTLCSAREEAEASLACKVGELQDIYTKLGHAESMRLQLQIAEEKAQAMEANLIETRAVVEDKEEQLAASEWAVQQLASEIAKAKHSLVRKEREEAFLQERLSDLERHLRDKEREMIEMNLYLDTVVQSNASKQADIDALTLKMQDLKKGADEWKLREIDLEMELHSLKNTLEMKEFALEQAKSEVQRSFEVHRDMEGAIESLKQQLADKGMGSSTQRGEMDRLCLDLESATEAANAGNTELRDLHERLEYLQQFSDDQLRKAKFASDELQHELLSTQSRFESCEQSLEIAHHDLAEYKEKCALLLDTVAKMGNNVEEMKGKLACTEAYVATQARVVEQADADRARALQDLHTQAEVQRDLERSKALTERQVGDLELHKEKTELEVRRLKMTLDTVRRESAYKEQEANRYKSQIEELQEISDQYGDAQVLISNLISELQMTSSTVEERDSRLLKLQSSLVSVQDELRASREYLAAKECEREHLAVKLTVMESQWEKDQIEMSQMQQDLKRSETQLAAEAENVVLQAAALEKVQLELSDWKEKSQCLAREGADLKIELEHPMKELEDELLKWKRKAEDVQAENVHLESAVQNLQCELEGWKERAVVTAQEGRLVRDQLRSAINSLQISVETWKQDAVSVEEEGMEMSGELGSALQTLQDKLRIEDSSALQEVDILSVAMKILYEGLKEWREKAICASGSGRLVRDELERSISDLRAELKDWKERAAKAGDAEGKLRGEFSNLVKKLQMDVEVWKNTAENGSARRRELEHAVDHLHMEIVEWKEKAAATADDERCVKMTHEASLVELQEELGTLKEKSAAAAEETKHLQAMFAVSMKEIEKEVQKWKQKSTTADTEGKLVKSELEVLKADVSQLKYDEKALAVADQETKHLQLELQQALTKIWELTSQLEHQKAKASNVEKLETDLEMAREEALVRKEKLLHILAQLERTHANQKELQARLKLQHKQLLQDDKLAVAVCSIAEEQKDIQLYLKNNVQSHHLKVENSKGLLFEKDSALLRGKALESGYDVHRLATDLEAALNVLSEKNIALHELQCEVSKLRSVVTQLESKRHATEVNVLETELADRRDRADEVAQRPNCRNGLVELQEGESLTQRYQSHRAADSISQPLAPSPGNGLRKFNLVSTLQAKPPSRAYSDCGSWNVLGDVDENSLLPCGPRSPAPLSMTRKSRENQSNIFMGSLL